jgi:hypothetical protein
MDRTETVLWNPNRNKVLGVSLLSPEHNHEKHWTKANAESLLHRNAPPAIFRLDNGVEASARCPPAIAKPVCSSHDCFIQRLRHVLVSAAHVCLSVSCYNPRSCSATIVLQHSWGCLKLCNYFSFICIATGRLSCQPQLVLFAVSEPTDCADADYMIEVRDAGGEQFVFRTCSQ